MLSTIVDEVDEMPEVGPEIFEDLEDFVKTGKQPFDHVYETLFVHAIEHFYCLHQRHDDEVTTWGGLPPLLPR